MNWFVLDTASTIKETEEIIEFFSLEHLKQLGMKLGDWSVSIAGKLIIAILIWIIGKKIIKLIYNMVFKMLDRSTLEKGIVHFAASMLKAVLYAILVLIVIDKLGFETTSLIALFGSGTLAIGLSLQGSLANFAGGVLILIFKPFKVGDYIIVGDKEGTVSSIELLYTRLVTVDNKVIMLPNGVLSNSNIVNVGAEPTRRIDIQIGISYTSDIKKAKALLTEVIKKTDGVIEDKGINVFVKSLDESCVTLETRAWVNSDAYWDIRFELLEKYKEIFDENGVEIPFNQIDVHMK